MKVFIVIRNDKIDQVFFNVEYSPVSGTKE